MASVFVLLEAFNRKEAAALGFFPCATASFLALSRTDSLAKSTIKIGCGGLLYGYFGMEQIIMHEERTRI